MSDYYLILLSGGTVLLVFIFKESKHRGAMAVFIAMGVIRSNTPFSCDARWEEYKKGKVCDVSVSTNAENIMEVMLENKTRFHG